MMSLVAEAAVAIGSSIELLLIAQATVLFGLGFAATRLAGRTRASVRHVVLASTFLAVLALPVASGLVPRVAVDVPVPASSDHSSSLQTDAASAAPLNATRSIPAAPAPSRGIAWSLPGWLELLGILWIAGAALTLTPLVVAVAHLARLRRDAIPCLRFAEETRVLAADADLRGDVEIVCHEAIRAPMTCGLLRHTIVLPSDARSWSRADIRRALIHELEHVRRNDWCVQLLARAVCAMYWFHPLAWAARRQLSLEAERACDDAVLETAEGTDYAEQLVQLASRLSHASRLPILAMANRSDLSARVSALLDPRQRRGRAGARTVLTAAGIAGLVVVSIAPLRAVAAPEVHSTARPEQASSQDDVSSADRALYRAARRGDLERIAQLLDAGANVDCAIDGDGSPLIAAARAGRLDAVALLLDRGATPDLAVPGDGNPLIMAAREGHVDVVALLLDRGAAIDEVVPADENALIQASGNGQLPVVKLLVSRGADVNARVWADVWTGEASIGVAGGVRGGVSGGVAGGVPGGVASGVSGGPTGEWRTPLGMARRAGHSAVVAFLLSAGARE